MLEIIRQALGEGWEFSSAGGITGNAYIAKKADERLFLKRNTSPFLAVLSAEGIVPRLIWTKRIKNGDVITAQKWLDGRELYPSEMQDMRVAKKLRKIHESSELLHMLMRLGIQPTSPARHYEKLHNNLQLRKLHTYHPIIKRSLTYLAKILPNIEGYDQVVCHADLNHNNLMFSADGSLYIVDWDHATIADPATDFSTVLYEYVPEPKWDHWLQHYGIKNDTRLIRRIYWYILVKQLSDLIWHADKDEWDRVTHYLSHIQQLNNRLMSQI